MKKLRFLKNKYILTLIVFGIYMLFLDDADVFTVIRQEAKLKKVKEEKIYMQQKFEHTKETLNQLDDLEALEKYAREKKLFKRDNEDLFVITYDEKK